MLWGSMAASGPSTMEFIDTTMDKMGYLNILKRNLQPSVQKLNLPRHYLFQQNNDPKHTSYVVREWLLYNVPKQLKTSPQSPDLNPIEHLWWEVKHWLNDSNQERTRAESGDSGDLEQYSFIRDQKSYGIDASTLTGSN